MSDLPDWTSAVGIEAQVITELVVDIASQSIGSLDINIAGADAEIDIKTAGGANIVIDKLTDTAYTARDTFYLTNDNSITSPTAPPDNYSNASFYYGKYFPRGCRGLINLARIYSKGDGATPLTVYFSPYPGAPEISTIVITPTTTWDWHYGYLRAFWPYDSIFMYVKSIPAAIQIGYEDDAAPYDSLRSADGGVTWTIYSERAFYRISLGAGSIGELPVSGTVTAIVLGTESSKHGDVSINVAAQDIDVTININAQNVAVKSQSEWSPQEGQQRYVTYSRLGVAGGTVGSLDISPTTGKDLYITHLSFHTSASNGADADKNQMGAVMLLNYSTATYLAHIGGNGGAALPLLTPVKIPDGQVVRMYLANWSAHNCEQYACWGGYEI